MIVIPWWMPTFLRDFAWSDSPARRRGSVVVHIEFWFEFGSTYSYPAAMRVEQLTRDALEQAIAWASGRAG